MSAGDRAQSANLCEQMVDNAVLIGRTLIGLNFIGPTLIGLTSSAR